VSNPFQRTPSVDDSNALGINIATLKNKKRSDVFNDAIDKLVGIRQVLRIIDSTGRLGEVGARTYYTQTLQWLNGQTSLSVWVSLPQISDIDSAAEDIVSLFGAHTTNMQNAFNAEPLYQQVNNLMTFNAAIKKYPYDEIAEVKLEEIAEVVAVQKQELEISTRSLKEEATQTMNDLAVQLEANFGNKVADAVSSFENDKQLAISELRQAVALADWSHTYEKMIEELEEKTDGPKFAEGVIGRNIRSLWSRRHNIQLTTDVSFTGIISVIWAFCTLLYVALKNALTCLRVAYKKLTSYRGQRNTAFLLLATVSITFVALSLLGAYGFAGFEQFKISSDEFWYRKLTVYLPIIIILGMGYSFAVKNFRIYSNMLDQYKHRRTVARTAQGVIVSLGQTGDAQDREIRDAMTKVAAQALFEHKATGHLSKKEAESASIFEMLKFK